MIVSVSLMIYSCASGKYTLNDYEKGKLTGYHANEANRLININKKNRKSNREAAEEYRKEQSRKLNELNNPKNHEKNDPDYRNRRALNTY